MENEVINSNQYNQKLLKNCGTDVFISANVEIRRPQLVSIGNHVAVDTGFYLTTAAEIGDYIHIAPYVSCIGGPKGKLIMEHFTTIAAGARIICSGDHHLGQGMVGPTIPEVYRDGVTFGTVTLKMFASIGSNAVIMPNITLAEGSVIGAQAVVTKDTEPWTIYIGSPARPMKLRKKETMIQYAKEMGYL